jgi:hypothetical protein
MHFMTPRRFTIARKFPVYCTLAIVLGLCSRVDGQPSPQAAAGFNTYMSAVEARLDGQHRSVTDFLAPVDRSRLRRGEAVIERVASSSQAALPGAMLHHWRGSAFIAGATAADFEAVLRDFDSYPKAFAPQVLDSHVLSQNGDRVQVQMRMRQKHIITVTMDSNYDVAFGRLDPQHRYSVSRSTQIATVDPHGSAFSGLLWRLNTYWSFEERDGGLYLQIESVSLSRSIPTGLGWLIGPFVQSVPRDSLEFTLRSAAKALETRH